jgi:hypothetical protein
LFPYKIISVPTLKQSRGLPGELLNLISGLFQFFVTCRLVFERSKANKNHKGSDFFGFHRGSCRLYNGALSVASKGVCWPQRARLRPTWAEYTLLHLTTTQGPVTVIVSSKRAAQPDARPACTIVSSLSVNSTDQSRYPTSSEHQGTIPEKRR